MNDDALESRLIAGYELQRRYYAEARQLIDQHGQESQTDFDNLEWTDRLTRILAEVAAADAALAADKAAWRTAKRTPGPRMKETLDRLADDIRELKGKIDPMIGELQTRRRSMMPEIDLVVRHQQMLTAYAASART